MSAPAIAPYGSWASPLSAAALAAGGINFGDLRSANGRLYWVENVPARGGEVSLFSFDGGATEQVTPNGANVRTRVHEYGGAAFIAVGDTVYYSQLSDQRLYELKPGGAPRPVTPPDYRYADCIAVPGGAKSAAALLCVREDHTDPAHVRNALVRLPLPIAGAGEVLFDRSDFVSYPRLSPDGRRLAFITWNHPNMPWDGTQLQVAELTAAGSKPAVVVAGAAAESVLEPQWDADGTLYFISDRSGFWNGTCTRIARRVHGQSGRAPLNSHRRYGSSANRTTCCWVTDGPWCASVSAGSSDWPWSISRRGPHANLTFPLWSSPT
jgi:hypothetical protein